MPAPDASDAPLSGPRLDDVRVHRALAGPSRRRLLDALAAHPDGLTTDDLAKALDLHHTTVRSHVDVLVDADLVTSTPQPRNGPGRPRLRHRLTANAGSRLDPTGYRLLAEMLTTQLATGAAPAADAAAAGRSWGRHLVEDVAPGTTVDVDLATARIHDMFDRLGFEPSVDGLAVDLHACPFEDLARRHEAVVCSLHRGMVAGALERIDAPLEAGAIEPWVTPSRCRAHLRERAGTSAGARD